MRMSEFRNRKLMVKIFATNTTCADGKGGFCPYFSYRMLTGEPRCELTGKALLDVDGWSQRSDACIAMEISPETPRGGSEGA